jgi:lambda repressor-like predicted transcriptional regulator
MLALMHREDVKAALRKKFGSVTAFERASGLPDKSVHDLLRGRKSARVEDAVNGVLNAAQSEDSDVSRELEAPHRLNAKAR